MLPVTRTCRRDSADGAGVGFTVAANVTGGVRPHAVSPSNVQNTAAAAATRLPGKDIATVISGY